MGKCTNNFELCMITTADFVLQVFPVAMQLHALSELVPEALLVGLPLLESESHR